MIAVATRAASVTIRVMTQTATPLATRALAVTEALTIAVATRAASVTIRVMTKTVTTVARAPHADRRARK